MNIVKIREVLINVVDHYFWIEVDMLVSKLWECADLDKKSQSTILK